MLLDGRREEHPDCPGGSAGPWSQLLLAFCFCLLGGGTPASAAAFGEPDGSLPLPGAAVVQWERWTRACVTPEEAELGRLINQHRKEHGLPSIPLSATLTHVAKLHEKDLIANRPFRKRDPSGTPCGLHSWSDEGPGGGLCYTKDRASARAMWAKPREVSGGRYRGYGFENLHWTPDELTPQVAFVAWRDSPPHNAIIVQQGSWTRWSWKAMGFALSEHYAVMWLGDAKDPLGEAPQCANEGNRFFRSAAPDSISQWEPWLESAAEGQATESLSPQIASERRSGAGP